MDSGTVAHVSKLQREAYARNQRTVAPSSPAAHVSVTVASAGLPIKTDPPAVTGAAPAIATAAPAVMLASPQSEELLREVNSNMRRLVQLMEQSIAIQTAQHSHAPPPQ